MTVLATAGEEAVQQAINALDAAGVGPIPVSGQDASAAGIQNLLLGNQTVTVYKPIQAEAETAVKAIPDARLIRLEGLGHSPQVEAPARFLATLTAAIAP